MMPSPTLSIIVVRTNGEALPPETLENLHTQTFSDYEIIVTSPHHRAASASNQAVRNSSGEYLAFIDSHQTWAPEKLEKQMARLAETCRSWCYCHAINSGVTLHSGNILRPLLLRNFVPSGSVIIQKEVFRAVGGFNESEAVHLTEEWDLWLRVAADHPVALVPEALVQLPNQPPHQIPSVGMKCVVEAAVARHQLQLKDLRSEALAKICVSAGNAHLLANRRDQARAEFAEALTHGPLRPDAYLSWVSSFLSSEAQQQIRDLHNLSRLTAPDERKVTAIR